MKIDNNTIAIIGLIIVMGLSLFASPSVAEKVILTLGGGVVGWMGRGLTGEK